MDSICAIVYRMSTNVEILDAAQKQLDLIQFYIAYCRLRLRKKRVDCFVEPDKAITASQILCIAADSTLKELDETELRLKELEAMIMVYTTRSFYLHNSIYIIII